jgi:thiamine pyrophosphate-dependent acetolactate synthase large subunit-like protein
MKPQDTPSSSRKAVSSRDAIGQYLLAKLYGAGARHIFGVPRDYILRFYEEITHSRINHIGTTHGRTAVGAKLN